MKHGIFSHFAASLGIFTMAVASVPMGCDPIVAVASDKYFRPAGTACAFDWQCASGPCSADVDNGTCGVCLEQRRPGERCDGPLLTCSSTAVCTNGVCQSTKGTAGAPCTIEAKGGSDDCDADFYCDGDFGGAGICTAKPDFGEACGTQVFAQCARQGDCERGICTPPREAGLGESCDSRPCMQNLACHSYDDGHTCEEPNIVKLNESCAPHIPNLDCEKGTQCELTGGPMGPDGYYPMACLAGKTEGQECASNHCAEGFVCSQHEGDTDFKCWRLGILGETCRRSDECNAGLECRKGVCMAKCQ